jgi:hypothetical protein
MYIMHLLYAERVDKVSRNLSFALARMKIQLYPFNELCFRVTLPHSTGLDWKDELWSCAEGLSNGA